MIFNGILQFIAGIGLLIYGVFTMSTGLEKIAGSTVRKYINKFARNRFENFGFGFLTTILLQSSTAATIMIIGFNGAGIISLFQALGMVIGSNVGTSLTPFLLFFKSINAVELLACVTLIGALLLVFRRNQKVHNWGTALLGFGILFCGLLLIDSSTEIFKSTLGFVSFLTDFNNPLLLLLIGLVLTVILQSSFGTIAILVSLAGTIAGASLIPLTNSAFIIYGANIGTCFTAIIASIPNSYDSKRVAIFHLIFNVAGAIVFSLLSFTPWLTWLESSVSNPTLQIILVNIIFKTVIAVFFMIFIGTLTKLMSKFFSKKKFKIDVFSLDAESVEVPTLALKKINYAVLKSLTDFKEMLFGLNNLISMPNNKNKDIIEVARLNLNKWNTSINNEALKISGIVNKKDTENISLVLNILYKYNRSADNTIEIIKNLKIKNSSSGLTNVQKEISLNLCQETINIANANIEFFESVYKEEKLSDFSKYAIVVLECSEYITQLKNEQKKLIVKETYAKETKVIRNTSYLSVINLFDSIGSELADATINISHFIKGDENEKKN